MNQIVYTADRSSRYKTTYWPHTNLEDVGDDFLTKEEAEDEAGVKIGLVGRVIDHPNLVAIDLRLAAKAIPVDKKSIALSDNLWEASKRFHGDYGQTLPAGLMGIRFSNGRMYNMPVEQKQVRVSDFETLKYITRRILHNKGCHLQFLKTANKVAIVEMAKKVVTWKEIKAKVEGDYYFQRDNKDIKWLRKLWLDPTLMEGK